VSKILRALSKDKQIAIFIMDSTEIVEETRKIHKLPPVPTAALGRLLTAASMMGVMLKGENQSITLQITCSGIIKGLVAVADNNGNVKGYVKNKDILTEINEQGKLNVKGVIQDGFLTVIKDLRLKEPYIGQIELVSGEIAEDITNYFVKSEQTPTAVALGVLIDKDEEVKKAGGFIIQILPDTDESVISKLEERISKIKNISTVLLEKNIIDVLNQILDGIEYDILQEYSPNYICNCSKGKVASIIPLLKDEEIGNEDLEIVCSFCETKYKFSHDEALSIKYKK